MDKTLEDEIAANRSSLQTSGIPLYTEAGVRRAVEMAIRRAAEVCATQEVFTGPKACAAAILKLLD
jgi:electron transfer flavoprotein alpha/beta subunit